MSFRGWSTHNICRLQVSQFDADEMASLANQTTLGQLGTHMQPLYRVSYFWTCLQSIVDNVCIQLSSAPSVTNIYVILLSLRSYLM